MKLLLCTIGTATLLLAAPAAAQEAQSGGLFWAPWQPTAEAPVPQVRPVKAVRTSVVAEVPPAVTTPQPIFRLDRFWVIGSFR